MKKGLELKRKAMNHQYSTLEDPVIGQCHSSGLEGPEQLEGETALPWTSCSVEIECGGS